MPFSRARLTAALAALSLVALAVLPAEHVHGRDTDHHGREQASRIHRHFEAHHPPPATATFDHAGDDHDVQWIAAPYTGPHSSETIRPGLALTTAAVTAPLAGSPSLLAPIEESAHDPPWLSALALRGPPAFSA